MIYKTHNGQSIFDVIINTTIDLDSTYALISANPIIKSIESVPIGVDIQFIAPAFTPPSVKSDDSNIAVTSKNFLSVKNQTIYDVVFQTYGSLDLTYKLIKDSNFTNIESYPVPRFLFNFNPQLIVDNSLGNYLKSNGVIINTGIANAKADLTIQVYGDEDLNFIYTNEDGTEVYTPES